MQRQGFQSQTSPALPGARWLSHSVPTVSADCLVIRPPSSQELAAYLLCIAGIQQRLPSECRDVFIPGLFPCQDARG